MGSVLSFEYSYTASSITHILFTGPELSGHVARGGILNHPDLGHLTNGWGTLVQCFLLETCCCSR